MIKVTARSMEQATRQIIRAKPLLTQETVRVAISEALRLWTS